MAAISSFANRAFNFFAIWIKMLFFLQNEMDIQLILEFNSFGKYHPVFETCCMPSTRAQNFHIYFHKKKMNAHENRMLQEQIYFTGFIWFYYSKHIAVIFRITHKFKTEKEVFRISKILVLYLRSNNFVNHFVCI